MNLFDDLSLMTRVARGELIHILESIFETKELIIEPCLMRPLDKLVSMSMLYEHGCRRVQQLHLERSVCWDDRLEHRVFLVRPSFKIARKVCELIKADPNRHYSIIFVDQRRQSFDRELERHGLFGAVGLFEFNMSLVPLESDLFSLELPNSNRNGTAHMAKALWRLQSLYGLIPTSFCIGVQSQVVDKLFRNLSAEFGEPSATAEQPISHMFLFDRALDIVTPLITCLTYESMLNDKFEYSCGKIIFGEAVGEKLREKGNAAKNRIFSLNNADVIFSTIRNLHMTAVFPFLSAKAKELQSSLDRVSGLKKVEDMKAFVANELRSLQCQKEQLEMHICACETILASTTGVRDRFTLEQALVRRVIDDNEISTRLNQLIAAKMSSSETLQLMCLWSICSGGIPSKHLKKFQEVFLQTYGYEYLPVMYRLRAKKILFERPAAISSLQSIVHVGKASLNPPLPLPHTTKPTSFPDMCSTLSLCPLIESKGEKVEGRSMGYMFSDAYIPVISRIIQMTVAEGWDEITLRRVFGENIPIFSTNPSPARPDNRIRKAVFVCFVGGVTYAEIASLRRFAQNEDFRVIIVTTNIINRNNFVQTLTN